MYDSKEQANIPHTQKTNIGNAYVLMCLGFAGFDKTRCPCLLESTLKSIQGIEKDS